MDVFLRRNDLRKYKYPNFQDPGSDYYIAVYHGETAFRGFAGPDKAFITRHVCILENSVATDI